MTAVSGTVVVTVTLYAMPGGGIAVDVTQYNEQTVEFPLSGSRALPQT